ncbi:hypothetical protein LTR78_007372 [Recurvomyces mirabilis]|uniref:Uncharacterized protein n=1 Tax=Recurvomyces mirabilis TaxID=574656 RepID=A0AAE0WJD4_9PEZI|nr:hypothetical protein LTR78_007372 [Recurvomyces mirabilis]KAK5155040.1 hypothetical protein LTS14_005995 [Recurvomyces mirabilis]
MATTISLLETLSSFTAATENATQALPDAESFVTPKDGITLLDTKNDIFLAYLQALALRNLNVIRSIKEGNDAEAANELSEEITKKLVEHRVYLERRVRPLEAKIKYGVDKVVKAADDSERAAVEETKAAAVITHKATAQDDESDDDGSSDSDEERAFKPSGAAFTRSSTTDPNTTRRALSKQDGIYRPPRIAATAMPLTTSARERKEDRRPGRSATVDEYISHELSTAPIAEPSIGSTIASGGRSMKSAKQQAAESERKEYEESNLVRLPAPSKKDKMKQGGAGAGDDKRGGFGGEEWRGLDMSLDRIGDLTRRKGGKEGAFERSKKRGRDVGDRNRDDGTGGMGGAFEVKRRRVEKKSRR